MKKALGTGHWALGRSLMVRTLAIGLAVMVLGVCMEGRAVEARGMEVSTMAASDPGANPRVTAELREIYGNAADQINRTLAESIKRLDLTGESSAAFRAGRSAELLKEIQRVTRAANIKGVKAVSTAVESSFTRGAALARSQAEELGLGDRATGTEATFAGIQERTVEAIARDTAAKMAQRTGTHGENAVGLFRSLSTAMAGVDAAGRVRGFSLAERDVNRVIADGIITGDPRRAMGLMRELIGKGAGFDPAVIEDYRRVGSQLIAVGGWTGTVRGYAEMVVRTRTAEAQREGQIERQVSLGIDLGQITGSNSSNFCTRFVGLVVVVRGPARDGYPALSDLPQGGPPFHPHCTKQVTAYVEDLVSDVRKGNAERASERYERALANGTLLEPVRDGRRAA